MRFLLRMSWKVSGCHFRDRQFSRRYQYLIWMHSFKGQILLETFMQRRATLFIRNQARCSLQHYNIWWQKTGLRLSSYHMETMTQARTHPSLATNIIECSAVGREQEMGACSRVKGASTFTAKWKSSADWQTWTHLVLFEEHMQIKLCVSVFVLLKRERNASKTENNDRLWEER